MRPKASTEIKAGLRAHIRKLAGSRLFLALHFLVLVREWIDESEFGRKGKPAPWFVVPKRLYLPDGRAVPVCTVLAPIAIRSAEHGADHSATGDLRWRAAAACRGPARGPVRHRHTIYALTASPDDHAVLKETQPHERRVALVPSVTAKLIKLGAKLQMQSGAADAIKLTDAAFKDVAFMDDRKVSVSDADVVLAVQPPALGVISAMKEGAILISSIYANKEPALVQPCWTKKSPALPWSAPAYHAGAGDGRVVDSIRPGGILRSATRRDTSRPLPAEDQHSCRCDRVGQGAGDGPWCRGPRGDRHRPPSGRGRRGL